jgi:hypothetical protein
MRQRTCLALNIPTDAFDIYFKDSLDRARSAGIAREQVADFMSSKYTAGASLFFSSNHWIDNVEVDEEVEVDVENSDPNTDAPVPTEGEVSEAAAGPGLAEADAAAPDPDSGAPVIPKKKIIIVKRIDKIDRWSVIMGLERVT